MMVRITAEQERPAEWLDALKDGGGYRALVDEAGSLGVAAHRLARALCRVCPTPMALPTLRELVAAARVLGEECSLPVPSAQALLQACDLEDLVVIEPLERTPAPRRVAIRPADGEAAMYAY
jgi:hypothetical protein